MLITNKGIIPQTSTVDFVGLIEGGLFIAFDAKETANKTSFPLANIKDHQVEYLKVVKKLGGLSFFMVQFTSLHEQVFICPLDLITSYTDNVNNGGRKSIPYQIFVDTAKLIPVADYITFLTNNENQEWLKT